MDNITGEAHRWWQMVVGAVVTLAVVSLVYLAQGKLSRKRRLPPGPRGWPVLGSLLSLGSLPQQSLQKLSRQYGPLMFLHLGSIPTLVASNSEMAEAILKTNDHVMASRPDLIVARRLAYSENGFMTFMPNGQKWRDLRKICAQELLTPYRISQFRDMRQRELLAMLHSILKTSQQEKIVSVTEFLSSMTFNNITQMMLSKSYCSVAAKSDSISGKATTVYENMRELERLLGEFNIGDCFPVLKQFDLQGLNKRTEALRHRVDAWLEAVLAEHRQQSLTRKQDESSKNFLAILLATSISKGPNQAEERLSIGQIKTLLTEIAAAGTNTSSAAVEWALAELLRHPSMLKRAQEELNLVVGKNRLVDEADIPELKYIQAVVKETLRLHPPAPLLLPHFSTEDCEISGYHIPAKSRVLVNLWAIQTDPLVWERPMEFDPDRFFNIAHRNMDMKGKNFDFFPFGSGRRICPGLNVGLLNVQFPLAQMLHTINWTLPEDQRPEELDMSELFGVVSSKAIPLRVLAKPRLSTDVIYPVK